MEVTGEFGVGFVKVIVMGSYSVCCVNIDESLMEDDKEMLEDLIVVVFNDVVCCIEEM